MVLAGQSNACNVAPYLRAAYAQPLLSESCQNGRALSSWSPNETPPVLWRILADELHQQLQAFVFWQGESDRANPNYLADLRAFAVLVRSENNSTTLRLVVVRILNLPGNEAVRAAQESFVANDVNALLVSSDGPWTGTAGDHLTEEGYRTVAGKIVEAVTRSN